MAGAGHPDRISALSDELLHVILSFLGDACEVTRTSVLSRRWRHVWVHAKSLTFNGDNTDLKRKNNLAGFVDLVLAQRGNDDMESLKIRMSEEESASPERVNKWLRYAAQRVVKSVEINLGYKYSRETNKEAVELPSHGKATSLSLDLAKNRLQLPAASAARYEALTHLTLWFMSFRKEIPGSTLGDFLTSCCPRLRRLQIGGTKGLHKLVLHTNALEELYISCQDQQTVDVTAPNLRIVHIDTRFTFASGRGSVKNMVKIVAPKLEEIGGDLIDNWQGDLDIHDLKSVRRLTQLSLFMHGKYYRYGDVGFSLLENCPGVQHIFSRTHLGACFIKRKLASNTLTCFLQHRFTSTMKKLVDLTAEGKTPLANVRSMVVRAPKLPEHHLLANVSSLLMRCPHLTSLVIDICLANQIMWECSCEAFADRFTIRGKLALESLQEVKITGFTGTDEEMQLVSLLLESSKAIKCLALSEVEKKVGIASLIQKIEREVDGNNTSTIGQRLLKIPCSDRGRWYFVEEVFIWTCDRPLVRQGRKRKR